MKIDYDILIRDIIDWYILNKNNKELIPFLTDNSNNIIIDNIVKYIISKFKTYNLILCEEKNFYDSLVILFETLIHYDTNENDKNIDNKNLCNKNFGNKNIYHTNSHSLSYNSLINMNNLEDDIDNVNNVNDLDLLSIQNDVMNNTNVINDTNSSIDIDAERDTKDDIESNITKNIYNTNVFDEKISTSSLKIKYSENINSKDIDSDSECKSCRSSNILNVINSPNLSPITQYKLDNNVDNINNINYTNNTKNTNNTNNTKNTKNTKKNDDIDIDKSNNSRDSLDDDSLDVSVDIDDKIINKIVVNKNEYINKVNEYKNIILNIKQFINALNTKNIVVKELDGYSRSNIVLKFNTTLFYKFYLNIINNMLYIIFTIIFLLLNILIYLIISDDYFKLSIDENTPLNFTIHNLVLSRKSVIMILFNTALAYACLFNYTRIIIRWFNSLKIKSSIFITDTICIVIHYIAGILVLVYSLVHTYGHFSLYNDIKDKNNYCINKVLNVHKIGLTYTNMSFLTTWPYVSGFILLFLIFFNVILYMLYYIEKLRWGAYYLVHRYSMLIFTVILCFHGYRQWIAVIKAWKVIVPVIVIFFIDKYRKYFYLNPCKIITLEKTKKYIILIIKPKRSIIKQYNDVFLSCPKIDLLEWHPYTCIKLVDKPEYIKFFIYNVGVWTGKIYNKLTKDYTLYISNHNRSVLSEVYVYSYVVLYATGISISTFEELFINFINNPNLYKNKLIYLIWVTNNIELINYYNSILSTLSENTNFKIYIYYTIKFKTEFDEILIKKIYSNIRDKTFILNCDLLKINNSIIKFGRPIFKRLLKNILMESNKVYFDNTRYNSIAIFYSGNPIIKEIITKKIYKYNYNTTRLHYRLFVM